MKKYGLLLFLLLMISIVTSLATMATNDGHYLRMYLASEITEDGRATLPVPMIIGELSMVWQGEHSLLGSHLEDIVLFSDGKDLGYFEGTTYNRYYDISLLWVELEWSVPINDSFMATYIVETYVNSTEGKRTLELNESTWTLGWLWQNHYSDRRPQDDHLYHIQTLGIVLIVCVLSSIIVIGVDDIRARNSRRPRRND